MNFQCSQNASHIQSLFRSWNDGDGWDESSVNAAEALLQVTFPSILRNFYLSWGKRSDYASSCENLLNPKQCFIHFGHLIYCIENQAVLLWGIPLDTLNQDDPPVYYTYNNENNAEWKLSHKHLTIFLDALYYSHAFAGGAVHGGYCHIAPDKAPASEFHMRQHYQKVQLESVHWGLIPSPNLPQWTLFVGEGIAIDVSSTDLWAASNTEKALHDLALLLDLKWEKVW